jgi:hypothetical protein
MSVETPTNAEKYLYLEIKKHSWRSHTVVELRVYYEFRVRTKNNINVIKHIYRNESQILISFFFFSFFNFSNFLSEGKQAENL